MAAADNDEDMPDLVPLNQEVVTKGDSGYSGSKALPQAVMPMEDEEERMCRYCFGGEEDGELISPCACSGSQKYAHLSCLRRWQRMVLVSQPTHPAFQTKDVRHLTCNVCNSSYTCVPPTRHDLMESFTGAEIAALINEGCVIGAHEVFSRELEQQIKDMPVVRQQMVGYLHWIRGAYLITGVEEEKGIHQLPIADQQVLNQFRQRLDESLSIQMQGTELRVVAAGSLAGVPEEDLRKKLDALKAPVNITLANKVPPNCGDDHVAAVNLTRPIEPISSAQVDRAFSQVCSRYYSAKRVELTHYNGGPVDPSEIAICLVPGGSGRGWTLQKDLAKAIELAHSRAVKRHETQGEIVGGQTVRLTGLKGAAHLNGELGLTLRFFEEAGRWLVRLRNGEGKQVKAANLEPLEGGKGRVYVFWGIARWSRTQLLGEIARGHWGLGRASVQDIALPEKERRQGLDGRLVFAPVTEMTEDFMKDASRQMIALRENAQLPVQDAPEEDE